VRPLDAAGAAAYVHGVAGVAVGERSGDGTTAEDVCDALPPAIADVVGAW
jgi:NAD(P)H-hydrate repair Nnr-like enzyme with NAD(P)H-hydrate dehydratase domain